MKLLRSTSTEDVLAYIAKRIQGEELNVFLGSPTQKRGVALIKRLVALLTEEPFEASKGHFRLRNGSFVRGGYATDSAVLGMQWDIIIIDSMSQLTPDAAEHFVNTVYPCVKATGSEMIVTHGVSYFDHLWGLREGSPMFPPDSIDMGYD